MLRRAGALTLKERTSVEPDLFVTCQYHVPGHGWWKANELPDTATFIAGGFIDWLREKTM